MQQLTATITESVTTLKPKFIALPHQNPQPTQKVTLNLFLKTNLNSGTIAILRQIEAEHDYYQTCARW
jgi:hypothetical protein